MEQNVPRRLARFYRGQNNPQPQENYSYNEYPQQQNQRRYIHNEGNDEENYLNKEPQGLPTMDYNDVNLEADKKNAEELRKIQEKNLVEKLALEEIEKFKVQNKRMPNSREEEQIAENLFKQLKSDSENSTNTGAQERSRRSRGGRGGQQDLSQGLNNQEETNNVQGSINTNTPQNSASNVTNVKDLFGDEEESNMKKGKENDEFDIGLGDEEESGATNSKNDEELTEISDIESEDKKVCPNCKKQTDKIVYCAKCGTAFCANCAKVQGADKLCPKCQTKIKF